MRYLVEVLIVVISFVGLVVMFATAPYWGPKEGSAKWVMQMTDR